MNLDYPEAVRASLQETVNDTGARPDDSNQPPILSSAGTAPERGIRDKGSMRQRDSWMVRK